MFWRPQLVPAVLRCVVRSLPSSRATTGSVSGARSTSQLSSTDNIGWNDVMGKALDVNGLFPARESPADVWAEKSDNLKLPPPPDAWTGRRLVVRDGDLQDVFHKLNQRLRQNYVAKEIALTVRHEKKGDKRARLRSERWRKRFADTVRKRVQLVSTIRRRGG